MSTDRSPRDEQDRARETARARARLERRAAERGVTPFDFRQWRAEIEEDQTPEEVTREVDEFLRSLREWRDTPPAGDAG